MFVNEYIRIETIWTVSSMSFPESKVTGYSLPSSRASTTSALRLSRSTSIIQLPMFVWRLFWIGVKLKIMMMMLVQYCDTDKIRQSKRLQQRQAHSRGERWEGPFVKHRDRNRQRMTPKSSMEQVARRIINYCRHKCWFSRWWRKGDCKWIIWSQNAWKNAISNPCTSRPATPSHSFTATVLKIQRFWLWFWVCRFLLVPLLTTRVVFSSSSSCFWRQNALPTIPNPMRVRCFCPHCLLCGVKSGTTNVIVVEEMSTSQCSTIYVRVDTNAVPESQREQCT